MIWPLDYNHAISSKYGCDWCGKHDMFPTAAVYAPRYSGASWLHVCAPCAIKQDWHTRPSLAR